MKLARPLSILAFALVGPIAFAAACRRVEPSSAAPDAGQGVAQHRARTLIGVWRPTALVAVVPGTEASVRAMNAQFAAPDAKAARVEYTRDRVISTAPGIAQHSAPYTIVADLDDRVIIHDYRDDVTILFDDDDHATIDRKNNPFGARMKIERVKDEAPSKP